MSCTSATAPASAISRTFNGFMRVLQVTRRRTAPSARESTRVEQRPGDDSSSESVRRLSIGKSDRAGLGGGSAALEGVPSRGGPSHDGLDIAREQKVLAHQVPGGPRHRLEIVLAARVPLLDGGPRILQSKPFGASARERLERASEPRQVLEIG